MNDAELRYNNNSRSDQDRQHFRQHQVKLSYFGPKSESKCLKMFKSVKKSKLSTQNTLSPSFFLSLSIHQSAYNIFFNTLSPHFLSLLI